MENKPKKINIRYQAYVDHPVPAGAKRAFNEKGYQIIDSQFAPEGYELPEKLQKILDHFAEQAEEDAELTVEEDDETEDPDVPAQQPANGGAPATPAAGTETPATPGAAPTSGGEQQEQPALYGSDTLPSEVAVGETKVQLGEIVAAAHTASGKTVEQWNALLPIDRDALLQAEIDKRIAALSRKPEDWTDPELREAIKAKTGVAPAWNAKHETLVEAYKAAYAV